MRYPDFLSNNDTIGVVSPSSVLSLIA